MLKPSKRQAATWLGLARGLLASSQAPHSCPRIGLPHGQAPPSPSIGCQARHGCSCTVATEAIKPIVPPQPGTVKEHSHHVMIRIPPPAAAAGGDSDIWWPPIMEKHPALVQAFAGVAEAKQRVDGGLDGVVKVTAYEHMEGYDKRGDQTRVEILIFPDAVQYKGVPHDRIKGIVSHHLAADSLDATPPTLGKKTSREDFEGLGLFVCTHMSRDSRCGVLGGRLACKLASLVDAEGLQRVRVFQASHVGGHKFAGNVLCHGPVSPCDGDWYGGITQENAAAFLNALVNVQNWSFSWRDMISGVGSDGGAKDDYLRKYWRGKMNLSKEEQMNLYEGTTAASETESDTDSSSSDSDSATDRDRN